MQIHKLRLKNGWSQQQLSEMSGLSCRTISRIESGQTASVETLKSLAAVFNVDFQTLRAKQNDLADPNDNLISKETSMNTDFLATESNVIHDKEEAEAFRFVRNLRRFYTHLAKYLFFVVILLTLKITLYPDQKWMLWAILGWGIGIVIHAFRTFSPDLFLGGQWEKRQVEKRLGRAL